MHAPPLTEKIKHMAQLLRELGGFEMVWKDDHPYLRASMPQELVRRSHPFCMEMKGRSEQHHMRCRENCQYQRGQQTGIRTCYAGVATYQIKISDGDQSIATVMCGPFSGSNATDCRLPPIPEESVLEAVKNQILSDLPWLQQLRRMELDLKPSEHLHPALRKVIVRLHRDPHRSCTASQLAKEVGLSTSRLQHLCKSQTDKTLHEWVTHYLLKEACQRLLVSESIKNVAYGLGFMDQRNFSTWFRKGMGMSPIAWLSQEEMSV